MKEIVLGTVELGRSLLTQNNVLWALVRKDLKEKYASSFLGLSWAVLRPLATVAIYAIFFGVVYNAHAPVEYSRSPYIVFLMIGFTPFQVFSEVIGRSPSLLYSNISMITKMVFPYQLFSVSTLFSALIGAGINACIIAVLLAVYGIGPQLSALWVIPASLLLLTLFSIGLSWILSCIGVLIRDTDQIVNIILTLLIFLTPVFYSHSMVEQVQQKVPILALVFRLNPLYSMIEAIRMSCIGDSILLSTNLIIYTTVVSLATFVAGALVFSTFQQRIVDHL